MQVGISDCLGSMMKLFSGYLGRGVYLLPSLLLFVIWSEDGNRTVPAVVVVGEWKVVP